MSLDRDVSRRQNCGISASAALIWPGANMKELRPGSTGRTEIRVLFAFDRDRMAILLVGGDKSDDWTNWYERNIAIADDRFEQHQAEMDQRRGRTAGAETGKGRSPKGKGRR